MEQQFVHEIFFQKFKKCLTTSSSLHFPILSHDRKTGNQYFRVVGFWGFFAFAVSSSSIGNFEHVAAKGGNPTATLCICPFRKVQLWLLVEFPDLFFQPDIITLIRSNDQGFYKVSDREHVVAGCRSISCKPCWVLYSLRPVAFCTFTS